MIVIMTCGKEENAMSNKRVAWVDVGKYLCIMFVILSHLESNTDMLENFYSPVFLTTFFFLSGYVYKPSPNFQEHFKKKMKGLLLPWFVFSNFIIISSSIASFREEQNTLLRILWNLYQIRALGDEMWFVAALFIAFVPFYFTIKWNKPTCAIILSCSLSVISRVYQVMMNPEIFPWKSVAMPWHLEYIFQGMLWMVLGYYYKVYLETMLEKWSNKIVSIGGWILYLVLVYMPICVSDMSYYEIPVSYIKSAVGIIVIVCLSKKIKSNKMMRFVGGNTLTYFGLHGKVYAVIEKLIITFANDIYLLCLENEVYSSILAIVLTIIISFVLIPPAMIINRWLPWVLGRKSCKA